MSTDKRIIWKEKDDLELMMIIKSFIEEHEIKTSREYVKATRENPNISPGIWFINERFDSWQGLLSRIGLKKTAVTDWNKISNDELEKLVKSFIDENNISSMRQYEKICVGKNIPCRSTLKKRFENTNEFFRKKRTEDCFENEFNLFFTIKEEIYKLDLQDSLSRIEFEKRCTNPHLPSVKTIMRRTGLSWEEIMEKIGFDNYKAMRNKTRMKNLQKIR